jgi:hypothetical protein
MARAHTGKISGRLGLWLLISLCLVAVLAASVIMLGRHAATKARTAAKTAIDGPTAGQSPSPPPSPPTFSIPSGGGKGEGQPPPKGRILDRAPPSVSGQPKPTQGRILDKEPPK